MVVVENITDEDVKRIMEETKQLNEEINVRQSHEEDIEVTLYARYKNKEISYNQMRKVCDKYNLDMADVNEIKHRILGKFKVILQNEFKINSFYDVYCA